MKETKNRKKMLILLGVAGLLGLVSFFFVRFGENTQINTMIAPLQNTDEWSQWKIRLPDGVWADGLLGNPDIPLEKRPGILLRTDASNNLLLKHTYGTVVYFYSPQTKVITEVSEDAWAKAAGKISYCSSHFYEKEYNPEVSSSQYPAYELTIRGAVIKTHGKFAINTLVSPSHTKAVILTADGPVNSGGWSVSFGLGGGEPTVLGRRYLEVLELGNAGFIQDPVGLLPTGEKYPSSLCWSNDENYALVYKPYENFSIIETNARPSQMLWKRFHSDFLFSFISLNF